MRLAWYVSPHGFGHAARSCAVLEALRELEPSLELTLLTTVPRWFFEESLRFPFDYEPLACDVGLVQTSAVEEDLGATVDRLDRLWAEAKGFHGREIPRQLRDSGAKAVVCDISPFGLLAAKEAGLPAILIESFTWDWIYEPLALREPRLAPWVERMRELFALADLRIRAEPWCGEPGSEVAQETPAPSSFLPSMEGLSVSGPKSRCVFVPPIARRPRSTPAEVRARLGLAPMEAGRPMVLVSMGGIEWRFGNLDRWRAAGEVDFVVPGGAALEERRGNLVLLPHHSPVFHPDLVAAADAVVGKLGYSTVAEAFAAGTRFLFVPRAGFREHPVLASFVEKTLPVREISLEAFESGAWLDTLGELLARAKPPGASASGAAATADVLARSVASRRSAR